MESRNNDINRVESRNNNMTESQITVVENLTKRYLESKGYFNTLETLLKEKGEEFLKSQPSSKSLILDYLLNGEKQFDPIHYFDCFKQLMAWIQSSLELYKPELNAFLFPLFIHSYLDLISKECNEKAYEFYQLYNDEFQPFHGEDLKNLISIKSALQVKESDFGRLYRQNKYGLKISKVGFELLIAYLQDNQLLITLRLINDYLSIKVVSAIPGTGELSDPIIGLTGHANIQLSKFHEQAVTLGHPSLPQEFKSDLEQMLKEEDNFKKRKLNKSESTTFQSLLDQYREITTKRLQDGFSRDEFPLPPSKGIDVVRAIQEIKEISEQVKLMEDNITKASICFYTLHNSHESANSIVISNNLNFMAVTMHDSYIKLFSLKGDKLRNMKATFNPTMVNEELDLERMREKGGSDYRLLIGHSGPVYNLSFSPCSRYLISCSEDGTVRLWNTLTFTCLSVYRGHNYPIWDIDFSPNGTYFVTGSHDRTARLWSTEQPSPLRIFAGHISDVDCVKFHPNGRYIATASSDHTARLWDISTGNCVRVFTGHTSPIQTLTISKNGKYLATSAANEPILIWDISSGKLIHSLEDKNMGVIYSLSFSYDDTTLFSGGDDYFVRIWNIIGNSNNPIPPLSKPAVANNIQTNNENRLIQSFKTKRTNVVCLHTTPKNLVLAAGTFDA